MKTIIHVNQHNIKHNRRRARSATLQLSTDDRPVLTCKTYKANAKTDEATLICTRTGRELGRFVYRPDKPLSCGAHVWFETYEGVTVK
jgi:hypothetical protein